MRYYINQQCPDNHYPYVVQPGDTLYRIAQRLEVSLQRIIEANPGIDPNNLRVGQVICIPACPPNHTPYIIRPGDTLYRIAQMYNVTVEDILDANPGVDPRYLRVGQRICIPIPPFACPPNHVEYTIRAGDTLYRLAQTYNTTVEAILRANPGIDPRYLRIGQIICIPLPPSACPPNHVQYTIRAGDTLYRIAQIYNTTVEAILRANPGINPNFLRIGQQICIPRTSTLRY